MGGRSCGRIYRPDKGDYVMKWTTTEKWTMRLLVAIFAAAVVALFVTGAPAQCQNMCTGMCTSSQGCFAGCSCLGGMCG